jgi:hypothetical protein
MPRTASRIVLQIEDIRVERIEEITKEDAIAEGIEKWMQQSMWRYKSYIEPMVGFWEGFNIMSDGSINGVHAAIASYRSLWAKIYGFESLNSNPWVWVIKFKRIKP